MRGAITPENLEWFEPLMTQAAAELIKEGAPVYAVGVTEEQTKTACGALVGYVMGGCFRLISLFVSPEYRRCGYGNLLIGELVETCREEGIGIEVSFTGADAETEALAEFLEFWFFRKEKQAQGEIYEITLEEALQSAYNKESGAAHVRCLEECQEHMVRELSKRAYDSDVPVPEGGFFAASIDRQISVVYERDNRITAYLLFDHSLGGRLTLCALCSFEKNPIALAEMIFAAMALCRKKYPADTKFYMQAINETSENLIHKVFPGAKAVSHTYYLRSR